MPEDQVKILGDKLKQLKKDYFPQILDFLKKAKYVTPVSFHGMTVSLCKLFHYFLRDYKAHLIVGEEKEKAYDYLRVEPLFCLAAIWGFGGVLILKDTDDWRKKFSDYWKSTFKRVKFPGKGGIFDYYVVLDGPRPEFVEWQKKLVNVTFEEKFNMKDITIPIPETLSIAELTTSLIKMNHPVLFIGNSGSGKTQLVNGILKDFRSKPNPEFYATSINFNYYTDSGYLQTMLEQELVK